MKYSKIAYGKSKIAEISRSHHRHCLKLTIAHVLTEVKEGEGEKGVDRATSTCLFICLSTR